MVGWNYLNKVELIDTHGYYYTGNVAVVVLSIILINLSTLINALYKGKQLLNEIVNSDS